MYAKIFTRILDSSIADNTPLRRFFMDLILLADQDGQILATPTAIATRLRVNIDEVHWGLKALMSPDPDSGNPDHDGRRIEAIEGRGYGWRLLNFEHYREIRTADDMRKANAKRQQAWRDRQKKPENNVTHNVTSQLVTVNNTSDSEAESKAEDQKTCAPPEKPADAPSEGLPPEPKPKKKTKTAECFPAFWDAYPRKANKKTARGVWLEKDLDEHVDKIIEHVTRRRRIDDQWKRGVIPHASTFLRQERWDDEIGPSQTASAKPATPSPAVKEPKRPELTPEQVAANQRRVNDVIKATIAGKPPV